MGLLKLSSEDIEFNLDLLCIPEFKILWDKDTSVTKEQAKREISFIYFMYSPDSPYKNYTESQRLTVLAVDFLKAQAWDIKIEGNLKIALEKYKELTYTQLDYLLDASKDKFSELAEHLKATPISKDNVHSVVDLLISIGKIAESNKKVEVNLKGEDKNKKTTKSDNSSFSERKLGNK